MNPIRAATLGVQDLSAAISRYRESFDYELIDLGAVDEEWARSVGAPLEAGAPWAVLRPASGRTCDIRLIETPIAAAYTPLRTYGWAAIELCVQDVHAVHDRMRISDFEIIGPPSAISGLPTIHPMQVRGPDGDIVFLTEIKAVGAESGLPTARAPIDCLFICVLACRDLKSTAAWVAEQLGVQISDEIEIPYRTLSNAFALPMTHRHRIATASHGGQIFLEFDQYPDQAAERSGRNDRLPPGVSIVTLSHRNLDAIPGPWLTPPRRREGAVSDGRRVGVLRMPEGGLIEVVEDASA